MARKRRDFPVPVWAVACALILLAGGLAVWVWGLRSSEPTYGQEEETTWTAGPEDVEAFADSVAFQATRVLAGLGVPEPSIDVVRLPEHPGSKMRWEVRSEIPGSLPLSVCNLGLARVVRRLGGEVLDARVDLTRSRLSMLVGLSGERVDLISLRRNPDLARTTGRIAIIVDDVGSQEDALIERFCGLEQPVTLSIFPGTERGPWIARQAVSHGHGVMIHLPMEPIDYPNRDPGRDAIFADYPAERIQELTRRAVRSVPHARGINNHMGSRVTEDREAVASVLRILHRQQMFFVDSVTSPRSIAYDVAQEMGVATGRNALFLDLKEDEAAVERALVRLGEHARREGTAIGIGHAKPRTLAVLERVLPELAREGFVFVRAEDAVR